MQRRDFMKMVLASAAMLSSAGSDAAEKPAHQFHAGSSSSIQDNINWAQFLSRHDLVWERLPGTWTEGAFIGNGLLGAMAYTEKDALRWDVGRSDVCDHRTPPEGSAHNLGSYYRARLYIGHFLLKPVGKITSGAMRLTLWDAETTGTLQTDQGSITWRAFVSTDENAITIAVTTTGQEHAFTLDWVPDISSSPRQLFGRPGTPPGYLPNPSPILSQVGETYVCTQTMLAGGEYDTVWSDSRTVPVYAPDYDQYRVFHPGCSRPPGGCSVSAGIVCTDSGHSGGKAPRLVASVLPAKLSEHSRYASGKFVLDTDVQDGIGDTRRPTGPGPVWALAAYDSVALRVLEYE